MQTHPAFSVAVDRRATGAGSVTGHAAAAVPPPGSASSHDHIRGGTFAVNPLRPQEAIDLFRPFRALYFGARHKPRATHWPSLARPSGRYLIRKIP